MGPPGLELEQEIKERKENDFPNWLAWAKKKADWYDPLVKSEDDILGCFTSGSLPSE